MSTKRKFSLYKIRKKKTNINLGQKQVGVVSSWKRGKLTLNTVQLVLLKRISHLCSSILRNAWVPYWKTKVHQFLFIGTKYLAELMRNCSWNDKYFAKSVHVSIKELNFLILDKYSSYNFLNSYIFCKTIGIHIISQSQHICHRLQPFDVTVCGPFKTALNRKYDLFLV